MRPTTPRPRPTGDEGRASRGRGPRRSVLVLLLLACLTVITLDARGGDASPLDPVRSAVGTVVGPVESATASAVRPFVAVGGFFRTTGSLRHDVARLEAENSRLAGQLAGAARRPQPGRRGRRSARDLPRHRLRPGPGPGRRDGPGAVVLPHRHHRRRHPRGRPPRHDRPQQRRSRRPGRPRRPVHRDGRSCSSTRSRSSAAGSARAWRSASCAVAAALGGDARLDLDLVDPSASATKGDALVTWGSKGGAPYVAGVPIGRVDRRLREPAPAVDPCRHRAVRRLHLARPGRRGRRPGRDQ